MNTLSIPHVTQFHNSSLPCLRRSVGAEVHVRAQIISFSIFEPK